MSSVKCSSHSWKRRSSSHRASRYRNCSTSRTSFSSMPNHLREKIVMRTDDKVKIFLFTVFVTQSSALSDGALHLRPALGRHELIPATVELPMIALAHAKIAGPGFKVIVESLMSQPHLCVQGMAPGHRPAACPRALLPVVHVVLFEGP